MIESVFIMTLIMGFIFFIISIFEERLHRVILAGMALETWLMIFANVHYIVVPGDTSYSDLGFNAFCLVFIFVSILLMVIGYMEQTNIKKAEAMRIQQEKLNIKQKNMGDRWEP